MTATLMRRAAAFALAAMAPLAHAQATAAPAATDAPSAQADAPTWAQETVHVTARREHDGASRTNRNVCDTCQHFAFPVVMPVQPRSVFFAVQAEL